MEKIIDLRESCAQTGGKQAPMRTFDTEGGNLVLVANIIALKAPGQIKTGFKAITSHHHVLSF